MCSALISAQYQKGRKFQKRHISFVFYYFFQQPVANRQQDSIDDILENTSQNVQKER